MVTNSAEARVSGVLFLKMGQTNVLGRYPFHLHLVSNGSKSYLRDAAIVQSFYRSAKALCSAVPGPRM